MERLNERLLTAWLTLTSVVNNERIVSEIPFNEAYVCNLLYRQQIVAPDHHLTATDLCCQTRMLKSQMNKVLASLESRGMIERYTAPEDRRKAYIRLRSENLTDFETVHAGSIALVDHVIERLGAEKAERAAQLLMELAKHMDEVLPGPGVGKSRK